MRSYVEQARLRFTGSWLKHHLTRHIRLFRKFKYGFTLAEVLITLGVIGVISAITIPQLIANYQKQITVTQLKAAYQIFSEAIERAKLDFGDPILIPSDIVLSYAGYSDSTDKILELYINPYILGVEKYKGKNRSILTKSKERTYIIPNYDHAYCVPQKGFCYVIWNHTSNYRYLFVDINGSKGPNIAGRDVFAFDLSPAQKAPTFVITGLGLIGSDTYKKCNHNGNNDAWNGVTCARDIILNGWKVPDDYPW